MSKKVNHIDQIAQQKLRNAEVNPPAFAWDRLQKDMDKSRSRKRVVFFTKLSAIAAMIVVFIGLGFLFFSPTSMDHSMADNQTLSDSSQNEMQTIKALQFKSDNILIPQNFPSYIITRAKSAIPTEIIAKTRLGIAYLKLVKPIYPIKTDSQEAALIAKNNLYKIDEFDFDWSKFEYAETTELIAATNKGWGLGLGYSPSYTSTTSSSNEMLYAGESSGIGSNEGTNANEQLIPSFTFGANLSYSLSDRWSILSGVYYLNQKNEIQNFYVVENTASTKSEFSTNSSFGNINISNNDLLYDNAELSNQFELNDYSNISNFNSDLIQQFEFIEIPLLISYKLISNKWRISLVGGFNTGFIIGNSVYIKNHKSEKIGTTEDTNSITFKSVLGFSFEYPLSKRLFLTIAPTYKYQLNSLNKVSVNNPHLKFLDIKTGISYHF